MRMKPTLVLILAMAAFAQTNSGGRPVHNEAERLARWKKVKRPFQGSALSARERQMVEKLVEATRLLDEAFWRQSDVGGYAYNASGTGLPGSQPHAVRSAGGVNYEYDANGSLSATTGVQTRINTWTAFNQPERMKYADRTVGFLYDHDYKRVQETLYYRDSNVAVRTTYMIHPDNAGGLGYEREISNGKDESRHYISVGGSVIGVVKTLNVGGMLNQDVSSDPNMTNYWHKDSLGSIVAVSNAQGVVTERMAFDAWGRRIKEAGGNDPNLDPKHGDRGFTGHEHLDELALVHMNGRIYDPLIGRFLSGDPVIQSPEDLQNYNRYSYVLNNPLRYTDPSGDFFLEVAMFLVGAALAHNGNSYWRMVGTTMMMYALSGEGGLIEEGLGTAGSASAFAAGGPGNSFLSAAIATAATPGSNGADIMGAGLFAIGYGVAGGLSPVPSIEKFIAHALLGCMQGAMSGGKCGPSAMAAVVGKGMSEGLPKGVDDFTRGVMTAIAGGTASVIGGGKFANGALQAGFGYLYNNLSKGPVRTKYSVLEDTGHAYDPNDQFVLEYANTNLEKKVYYRLQEIFSGKAVVYEDAFWKDEGFNLPKGIGGKNTWYHIYTMDDIKKGVPSNFNPGEVRIAWEPAGTGNVFYISLHHYRATPAQPMAWSRMVLVPEEK